VFATFLIEFMAAKIGGIKTSHYINGTGLFHNKWPCGSQVVGE
jgi:hypothetical protein